MYDHIKTLAAHLLMPQPVTLVLLVLGLILLVYRFKKTGLSLLMLAVLTLYLASTAPVAHRLLLPLEARYPPFIVAE